MQRDFDEGRRAYLLEPLRGLVSEPVECSESLVEPILLRPENGSGFAVTLTNWAYRALDDHSDMTGNMHHVALEPARDLRLVIHQVLPIRRVYSVVLGKDLEFQRTVDGISLNLERLDEGDVLRLE
jgi:hypothetical protein